MSLVKTLCLALLALFVALAATNAPATAQQPKPNILFIMGDDIGWMRRLQGQGSTQMAAVCIFKSDQPARGRGFSDTR
jgi:hypothetical protein